MRKSITPAVRSIRRALGKRAMKCGKNFTAARTSRRPAWQRHLDTVRLKPSAAALLFGLLPGIAAADGARDWMNLPIDTNLVYLYYNHVQSNTQLDTTLPVQGVNATMNMALVRYAYSFPVAGKTGGIQFLLPYSWASANIDSPIAPLASREFSKNGTGDLTVVLAANLFGAPALTREAFAKATPQTLLTSAVFLTVPIGQYDRNKPVNFGGNRWVVKPQLAFNYPFGKSMLSVNGNVSFYTENGEYFQPDGQGKLQQAPLGTLEAHYSYSFNRALWAAVDMVYSNGGQTRINGVKQDNAQNTLKLGVSGSFNFTPTDAVAASFLKTVGTPAGAANVKVFSINYNHAW
ncbi:transporter [Cupriavidus basilensis]|uniref:transporter n=1 Tax=Cupriavidus basilensis TaxID=68895 RepID=UPI0020A64048|nr:transporter [Cupriavidus basilensis]MCP3018951.1 transporter [Cupriavidus basilensis]